MSDEREKSKSCLVDIVINRDSLGRNTPDVEHEREVAIFDLLDDNYFEPDTSGDGPFTLHLSFVEGRLVFDIVDVNTSPHSKHIMSMTPFRSILKDYFLICDSYFEAIKTAPPSKIEAIDMGRRGLHDEGSRLLMERLRGKIKTDFATARRLFTLICALQRRG
ncbi:MAG: UPF0262 family protein [Methyloligellaceae bacterium]